MELDLTEEIWQEIETLTTEVRGRLRPNIVSVRKLGNYFNEHVMPMDLNCGKCLAHIIEYWFNQCQKRKQ